MKNQELKRQTKLSTNRLVIKSQLADTILNFAFIKKDGSTRIANGTTNLDLIPEEFHPKGGKASDKVICYFDTDKGAWRSLSNNTEFITA
jgi:hypothetical protein